MMVGFIFASTLRIIVNIVIITVNASLQMFLV